MPSRTVGATAGTATKTETEDTMISAVHEHESRGQAVAGTAIASKEKSARVFPIRKNAPATGSPLKEESSETNCRSGPETHRLLGGAGERSSFVQDALRKSRELYLAELPALLDSHRGEWAAYTPTGRIVLNSDPEQVYRECCDRGLRSGEFLLCRVEPDVPMELNV